MTESDGLPWDRAYCMLCLAPMYGDDRDCSHAKNFRANVGRSVTGAGVSANRTGTPNETAETAPVTAPPEDKRTWWPASESKPMSAPDNAAPPEDSFEKVIEEMSRSKALGIPTSKEVEVEAWADRLRALVAKEGERTNFWKVERDEKNRDWLDMRAELFRLREELERERKDIEPALARNEELRAEIERLRARMLLEADRMEIPVTMHQCSHCGQGHATREETFHANIAKRLRSEASRESEG